MALTQTDSGNGGVLGLSQMSPVCVHFILQLHQHIKSHDVDLHKSVINHYSSSQLSLSHTHTHTHAHIYLRQPGDSWKC